MTILSLLLTAFILYLFRRKKRREGKDYAYSQMVVPAIATLVISSVSINLTSAVGRFSYSYVLDNKYEATVVDYEDMGGTRMAIVEFRNEANKLVRKLVGYGSSDPIKLGTHIKVSYTEGKRNVKVLSFSEQKFMVGITVFFFFVSGLAMLGLMLYVLDRDISFIFKIGLGFLMFIVFPAGMLFFIGILSWVIWEYLQGRRDDMPIWALGICVLFLTLLIPSFLGYIRMLFNNGFDLNDL